MVATHYSRKTNPAVSRNQGGEERVGDVRRKKMWLFVFHTLTDTRILDLSSRAIQVAFSAFQINVITVEPAFQHSFV